jgi:DNA-binding protein HU-beta
LFPDGFNSAENRVFSQHESLGERSSLNTFQLAPNSVAHKAIAVLVFMHGLQTLICKAFRGFPELQKRKKSTGGSGCRWSEQAQTSKRLLIIKLWSARMNKSDLVDAIASSAGLSKADAGRAVDAFVNNVTGALQSGQAVSLVGFGTFSVRDRAARMGRNPRTGEAIHIAASKNPAFKAGKALKDAVN